MRAQPVSMILRVVVALACVSLAACATTGSEKAEVAWQALNAIDTGMTAQAMTDGSCREGNPLIGQQSPGAVIAIGTIFAVVHRKLTRWLEDNDASRKALIAWHGLGIAVKGAAVVHNATQDCAP